MPKKKPSKKYQRTPRPDPSLPQAIALKQAAAQIGVSYWTALRLANDGALRTFKLPGADKHSRILVRVDELHRFLNEGPFSGKQIA